MTDTIRKDTVVRTLAAFEFQLDNFRRGLNDSPREATAASVRFELADGTAAGGPFTAAWDAEVAAWVAPCDARTEPVGTVLTTIATFTIGGQPYEQRGTMRLTA